MLSADLHAPRCQRSSRDGAPWPSPRRVVPEGFTLIEILVSVVVLAVGLLALMGASAVVAHQIAGGAQLTIAATVAQSRFETMRARPCRFLTGGSSEQRGIREVWTVVHRSRLVEVTDTVVIPGRDGQRTHAIRSSIPCLAEP
jgi:prepilin-type N-terminal cleavage/methylation domain-containing protein